MCDFRGLDLQGVQFDGVDLRGMDLRWTDLRGANLCGADLRGADIHEVIPRWLVGAEARWDEEPRWPEGFEPPVEEVCYG